MEWTDNYKRVNEYQNEISQRDSIINSIIILIRIIKILNAYEIRKISLEGIHKYN